MKKETTLPDELARLLLLETDEDVKTEDDSPSLDYRRDIRSILTALYERAPYIYALFKAAPKTEFRIALTEEQLRTWMDFIRQDETYSKYYDEFVVLLDTGLRVSEFCGLTRKDLDFKNRRIRMDHQLLRELGGKYHVEATKTASGIRYIPMTDAVYRSLNNMLANRPKVAVEPVVDGMTGFIMLDKNGRPKVALHIENELRWAMKKYRKLHPDKPLPHITPHVFRHTFCTNYANAGMDIKNLQYLMGHSDAGVTLNVYTHASYSHAASQMVSLGRSWSEVPALKTADCAAVC